MSAWGGNSTLSDARLIIYGDIGPYQAGKGTTGRANAGGNRRATNHTEGGRRGDQQYWNGTVY